MCVVFFSNFQFLTFMILLKKNLIWYEFDWISDNLGESCGEYQKCERGSSCVAGRCKQFFADPFCKQDDKGAVFCAWVKRYNWREKRHFQDFNIYQICYNILLIISICNEVIFRYENAVLSSFWVIWHKQTLNMLIWLEIS